MEKHGGSTFVCQLDQLTQARVLDDVRATLGRLGYSGAELAQLVGDAMDSRLSDLADTIDITPYFGGSHG